MKENMFYFHFFFISYMKDSIDNKDVIEKDHTVKTNIKYNKSLHKNLYNAVVLKKKVER